MGFAEQLARMKTLLAKADSMDMLGNPEMYKLTLQQIIGELEIMARKKRLEIENIKQQIAFCDGQVQACEMMTQIVGNLLENLISKESAAREEVRRVEEERRSRQEGPSGPVEGTPSSPEPSPQPPSVDDARPRRRVRPPKE